MGNVRMKNSKLVYVGISVDLIHHRRVYNNPRRPNVGDLRAMLNSMLAEC